MTMNSILWLGTLLLTLLFPIAGVLRAEDSPLSVQDAIGLAIQHQLSQKLARAATEEARGQAMVSAAGLLPQVTGSLRQSRVFKVNLESQGFEANNPAFASLVGPFNSFDARLALAQPLVDAHAFWTYRAGREGKNVAVLQERLAGDQVAAAAALAYLEAMRTRRAVVAAQSDLNLSDSLLKLAKHQQEAGLSTGLDVARAATRQSQERLHLIRAQLAVVQSDLKLKRLIGAPFETSLVLPELPQLPPGDLPTLTEAIELARQDRTESRLAKALYEAASHRLRAARSENVPTIKALADYGFSGTTPDRTARTGSIGARLDMPIISGGGTKGLIIRESAQKQEAEDRYMDIQRELEEDVRLSLETLRAERTATETASQSVALAQRELQFAKDRFSTGMGDNIQVLNAQTSLARALADEIDAFARLDIARVNLSAALGHIQEFK